MADFTVEWQGSLNKTIEGIKSVLANAGLQIKSSFDLQATRALNSACRCQEGSLSGCRYNMVVFLVYGNESQPITLIMQCYEGRVRISLIDMPDQRPSATLKEKIIELISTQIPRVKK